MNDIFVLKREFGNSVSWIMKLQAEMTSAEDNFVYKNQWLFCFIFMVDANSCY
jgi:hypothetical protein